MLSSAQGMLPPPHTPKKYEGFSSLNFVVYCSSVGYAEGLVHNVAEKKLIPDRKLSTEKPRASYNETQIEDGVRRISILNRKPSADRKQSPDRKQSIDRKPSLDLQSTEWRPSPEQKISLNNGFSIDRKSSQDNIVDLKFKGNCSILFLKMVFSILNYLKGI